MSTSRHITVLSLGLAMLMVAAATVLVTTLLRPSPVQFENLRADGRVDDNPSASDLAPDDRRGSREGRVVVPVEDVEAEDEVDAEDSSVDRSAGDDGSRGSSSGDRERERIEDDRVRVETRTTEDGVETRTRTEQRDGEFRSETRTKPAVGSPDDDGPRQEIRIEDDRTETRTREDVQGTKTYAAGDAGSVTITQAGGNLTLDDAAANAGWTVKIEQTSGREVEARFETADRGLRVDFSAQLEGDLVKVKVRERVR